MKDILPIHCPVGEAADPPTSSMEFEPLTGGTAACRGEAGWRRPASRSVPEFGQHAQKIRPLKIGNIQIDFPVALAPMAGYTDAVMRGLCEKHHCGLAFTEVTNSEGIIRGQRPTLHLLETVPGEYPVAAHIYGADPETLALAAAEIEKLGRFQLIDINCGCPVRKIVAKGAGVALMKKPEKIGAIVKAVSSAVKMPVTIKTRIGISPTRMNISEVAQAVQENGGAAIFIHARFATAGHTGVVDWETLARIKSERTIPVIGNGGVASGKDALAMLSQTGVDGVMIGKAAVGNPWVFDEIYSVLLMEQPYSPHSPAEHRAVIEQHLRELALLKEKERKCGRRKSKISIEESTALHFRSHLVGYLRGFKGFGEIRRNLQSLHSISDVMAGVDKVLAYAS